MSVQKTWQESLDLVMADKWAECVRDVENDYWQKDKFIEENVIEPLIISVNACNDKLDSSDNESDSS